MEVYNSTMLLVRNKTFSNKFKPADGLEVHELKEYHQGQLNMKYHLKKIKQMIGGIHYPHYSMTV